MDNFTAMIPTTPAEPPNGEYNFIDRGWPKGKQLTVEFPNGYGASVIQGKYSYGGEEGKYELAVRHKAEGDDFYYLCYATPITNDVLGWLDQEDVVVNLHKIIRLSQNENCTHKANWDEDKDDDEHLASIGSVVESILGLGEGLL